MKEWEKLRRVRAQAMLVRRLGEQLQNNAPGRLHAMTLDGMPRAKGMTYGLDAQLAKQDALNRMAQEERARLREYEQQARRLMDTMKPELYTFCAMYYIAALPLEETAQAIDRSERQCMRYKREIEREQADFPKEADRQMA